jgi:enamine deaminase RidA (YjgF/YER057c/UK114 family)
MKKEIINIPGLSNEHPPFNHVVKADNFLFLTSQISFDLTTEKIKPGNIEEQTENALENVKFLLEKSTRTTIIAKSPLKGIEIEIEVIAIINE